MKFEMQDSSYILVTPCKNEEENLPNHIDSIAKQTIKPVLWVIVDDGSNDKTPHIIQEAEKKYLWIISIRLDSKKRDMGPHYATVLKKGFDYAIEYCKKNNIIYEYLANVDGDITLEHTFFENLIREFEKDLSLGIASGGTKHIIGDRVVHAKVRVDEPSGGHMIIRRKCFEECGGIPISYACDSVLKAKTRLRGWSTRRFEENIATEIRDVNSAEGYWKGFFHKGEASYYLNFNPLHVLIRIAKYSIRRPYYKGIAYFLGYLNALIKRKEKIRDTKIREYYWNRWRHAVGSYLKNLIILGLYSQT